MGMEAEAEEHVAKIENELGLSISQNIVKSHGGAISFESDPGSRTTFTVRLPCAR